MTIPDPNTKDGIEYWKTQPASYDGVLGGFGSGTLPRVDSLGSRQFLLSLLPELSIVPSPICTPSRILPPNYRSRALDVGAGIGRVTADVLLHLVRDVVLLEPVDSFITEAWTRCSSKNTKWKGIAGTKNSVHFYQSTLQEFDPSHPERHTKSPGRIGFTPATPDTDSGFDVIWCQWCLGHLNDADLVSFFKRSKKALRCGGTREGRSFIVVKENLCSDPLGGGPRTVFDEQDSSLTRNDMAWKELFAGAGLRLVAEQVQNGLPQGLYVVKM